MDGYSEGLILKRQFLTSSEEKEVGRVSEKRGSLARELFCGNWRYRGGIDGIEEKEEDSVRSLIKRNQLRERQDSTGDEAWDKEAKEEEPEASGATSFFFACLSKWILKSCFAERQS